MTVDQILKRHTARDPTRDTAPEDADTDNVENLGGYGLLRGVRDRAMALELRKKDDTVLAIPYTMIEQFLFSPADGITLRAAGREIRVRGRGLNEPFAGKPLTMFSALTRHRVSWVVEQSRSHAPAAAAATVIESITW